MFSAPRKTTTRWSTYRYLLLLWAICLLFISYYMLGDDPRASTVKDDVHGGHKLKSKLSKLEGREQASFTKIGHKRCANNGTCECDKGYEGELCEQAICEQRCGHGKCLRPGYCTCEDGWKGRSCDEPVCTRSCNHGRCLQPNFCACDESWHGLTCDQQCEHGTFSFQRQGCDCDDGWFGKECKKALCNLHGCENGECIRPDECRCFSGWRGENCTTDLVMEHAQELMEGLMPRIRHIPALIAHKGTSGGSGGGPSPFWSPDEAAYQRDAWRHIRKWTAHLQTQWKFGRTRFTEALPVNDTLLKYTKQRFTSCAAVGNSGGLLKSKAGDAIDRHDVVLRYNDAVTKGFEQHVGSKTTFRLLNRKWGDALLESHNGIVEDEPPGGGGHRKKGAGHHRNILLLWRAESYHYYGMVRKRYPDETIYLLAPEFLIPSITLYKTVMKRLEGYDITWEGVQSAPTGFVGIAFLLQMCQRVDVYGFDSPSTKVPEPSTKHFVKTGCQ
eukprot:jgi/Mesvir1/807/Mv17398-RA.1